MTEDHHSGGGRPQGGDPEISNHPAVARLPMIAGACLALGMLAGAWLFGGGAGAPLALGAGTQAPADKLRDILTYIGRYYVDTVDAERLAESAIEGMLRELDPHTAYIPARDYELANAPLEGEFVGIGIEYQVFHDTINVMSTVAYGPADQAGIIAGDKIVEVDGKPIAGQGLSDRELVDRLRGERGSKVEVAVLRMQELKRMEVVRDRIATSSIDVSYMVDGRTGYIRLARFGAKTYDEFADSLQGLMDAGMERLVLDLRDNGGGYLDRAIRIADEFLGDGKLVVYTRSREERFDEREHATDQGRFEQGALVVLVNEYTASASEILAGALQDHDRAWIVGRRSFGKGLVQRPIRLSDGSGLRLTISRYYTPVGRSIQKPYEEGGRAYAEEISERYRHGEMFSADSVRFDGAPRYETPSGRAVYGGGGIMPDVFVPIDTSYQTPYYMAVEDRNLLREFALRYANGHRQALQDMGMERFIADFAPEQLEEGFLSYAAQSGLALDREGYEVAKAVLLHDAKAHVARNIWKDRGFYPIYLAADPVMRQALEVLGRPVGE
jgi:carboxyl-terminal processing protease